MRNEGKKIEKNNNKKPNFYDDDTLSNMRNYYNIEDHTELLKFIKKNGLVNNDELDGSIEYSGDNNKKRIEITE